MGDFLTDDRTKNGAGDLSESLFFLDQKNSLPGLL